MSYLYLADGVSALKTDLSCKHLLLLENLVVMC